MYDKGPKNKNGVHDIVLRNDSVPWFPDETPLWARVLCLLGYHRAGKRETGVDHKYHGMKLRDQCDRCGLLL